MKTVRFVSTLAMAAAVALPAAAQANTSTNNADASTADIGEADPIVVTASRSGDAISADMLGSSVTVIDAEALESRQTRVLSDVLRDVPGVAVNRTGAVGGQTQVRIRGSEANHVLVFIDGIKASDPYQGEFDFATLLADPAARVEVLRGQQSSLYGSDAIGGVITYTTLSGREAPGVSGRAEGGSFGTISSAGRVAGTVGKDADYALSATYLSTDGYPTAPGGTRNIGSNSLGLSGKANWNPAPNVKLTAVARYSYTKADQNDQGIGATSPVVQGYQVVSTVDTPGSYYTNKAFYGLVRAQVNLFDNHWTNAVSAQITQDSRDGYASYGYTYGDRGHRWRGSFESTGRFDTGAFKHRITVAVDGEREFFRAVDPSGYAYTGRNSIGTLGVVGQYDLTMADTLALGGSIRHDSNERFGDTDTFRFTGSYRFPTQTRIHAAYGTGVKSPTATELFGYSSGQYIGNPNLRPERSRGWEAGIEQGLWNRALTIGATWFHSRFTNQIETAYVFANGQYLSTTINNAVVADQSGLEVYANARLGDWRADAAYTYLDAPQTVQALTGQADGTYQLPSAVVTQAVRRPQHTGSFALSYVPKGKPFSATLTLRYTGRQRDYAFNSYYQYLLVNLKASTLINLNATYDLTRRVQLFGRLENLLGEKYQEVFTYRTPGRAAYGGVRVTL